MIDAYQLTEERKWKSKRYEPVHKDAGYGKRNNISSIFLPPFINAGRSRVAIGHLLCLITTL